VILQWGLSVWIVFVQIRVWTLVQVCLLVIIWREDFVDNNVCLCEKYMTTCLWLGFDLHTAHAWTELRIESTHIIPARRCYTRPNDGQFHINYIIDKIHDFKTWWSFTNPLSCGGISLCNNFLLAHSMKQSIAIICKLHSLEIVCVSTKIFLPIIMCCFDFIACVVN
jgi:hypothetical protein